MAEDDFHFIMKVIFERISIVNDRQIQPYKNVALKTMKAIDIADAPIMAAALSLGCPIWSNDKHFKRQTMVKTFTTKELIIYLQQQLGFNIDVFRRGNEKKDSR